jgi:N utilization substance protein B
MVNRILIRIKVVQIVYAFLKGKKGVTSADVRATESDLVTSLEKAYELYHYLLVLMVELTDLQKRRIETAKAKHLPTHAEQNPNTRFIDNRFISSLRNNPGLLDYLDQKSISWVNEPELLKHLLDEILASEFYHNYMVSAESSYEADRELWRNIFKNIILPNQMLADVLEDQSLFWNDDLDIVGTFALKTIKKFGADESANQLLPMFKDEEDREFALKLLKDAILKQDEYRALIDEATKHWDIDRIAFMDIVIMVVALAEICNFPSIPVRVSLNEYIEIAKAYSTQRSSNFINGVLDNIVKKLKREGRLQKND